MAQEDNYEDISSEEYVQQLMAELNQQRDANTKLSTSLSSISGLSGKDSNLIQVQIDAAELLERLEHFYRGDHVGTDDDGNQVWLRQKNKDLVTLNDFGVSSLMEIVTKYIDKNTFLSYYDETRIYEIMGDIGDEMTLFILCNYEKMGMNTHFKKTKFRLLVFTTLHIIESAYRRAIRGETSRQVNESRIVSQVDSLNNRPPMQHKRRFSLLDPRSWG